tara:strand:+ start:1808 stop:2419 length:612 start_codon:yes stop_codon:yes gene_type:complete
MKIGFFGGSFDPPHKGHKKIINKSLEIFDKVLIIPNSKSVDKKKMLIESSNHRFNMLNLMFDYSNVEIVDYEIKSKLPNYTYYTLKFLMNKYKQDNISMIIGQDQLLNLINWYNYKYIIQNVSIVCFRRNFKNLNFQKDIYKVAKINFIDFECDISSTDIRTQLSNRNQIKSEKYKFSPNKFFNYSLDSKVLKYINNENLYLC